MICSKRLVKLIVKSRGIGKHKRKKESANDRQCENLAALPAAQEIAKLELNLDHESDEIFSILIEPFRVSGLKRDVVRKRQPDLWDHRAAALVHVVFQLRANPQQFCRIVT